MNLNTKKTISYFVATLVLAVASFIFLTPEASAKIVVDGSREFTDDVNGCLNAYRNAPGIVGDVIKELENSDNEHKIINSPDWSNTSNDIDKATGGSGSGTVTRVDKAELEKYKKDFPELKNKDFCTALLHELWHAVDADRGSRTSHADKVDGVKRNEIEATIFQNFVHAIRGVDLRTSYGKKDISKHVLLGDEPKVEEEKKEVKAPEPKPEPKLKTELKVATSFKHVAPGEYSEVYATVTASPGASIEVTLSGPGVDGKATQKVNADDKGVVKLTWRIVSYGKYVLKGVSDRESFTSDINVQ